MPGPQPTSRTRRIRRDIVVGGDRSEFFLCKRRHPEAVDQRLAHDQIQGTHIPHSNRLQNALREQKDMLHLPSRERKEPNLD